MIELQPRGLLGEATLAKLNEIITKFNNVESRVASLEGAAANKSNETITAALKQADDAIQKAIAHFSKEVK